MRKSVKIVAVATLLLSSMSSCCCLEDILYSPPPPPPRHHHHHHHHHGPHCYDPTTNGEQDGLKVISENKENSFA